MASGFIRSASFKIEQQEIELTKYVKRLDGVENVAYISQNDVPQRQRKTPQGNDNVDNGIEEKTDYEDIDFVSNTRSLGQEETTADAKLKKPRKVNVQKWLVLLAAFLCRMLGEGFSISMGVFYVEFLEYFQSGRGVTGWAVSLTAGITYGAGIPISFIVYKTSERICCILGGVIITAGLISSFFASNIYFLLCTFGIVTGIGMAFIQISFAIAVGRHFRKGRGPATAICETGATIGGIAFPPLLRFLIDTYGWRGAVLISAGILLNIAAFGMLFSPPNRPRKLCKEDNPDGVTKDVKYCDPEIKRTRLFIAYVIVSFITGMAFFFLYGTIVDIGNLRNYGIEKSTFLVIALSVANTVGVFIMAGFIKLFYKRITLLYTLNVLLLAASLYVFPFTTSYETLVVAIVLFGIPAGGIAGSYAVVVLDLLGEGKYTTGLGFVCSAYGLGMTLSTPVAGWINEATGDYETTFYYAGSICAGAALLFGASLFADKCIGKSRLHSNLTPTIQITVDGPSNTAA